jgi:hypothetical protein
MGKVDVEKDLDTIGAYIIALMEASNTPKQPKGKEKGKEKFATSFEAMEAKQQRLNEVMEEHTPKVIDAAIRVVGGLFVNLQRIADSIEDQAGAG